MKVLIVTPYVPYPLSEGGKISQFAVSDRLRDYCELSYLLFPTNDYDIECMEILKDKWKNVSFYSIRNFIPISKRAKIKNKFKNILYKTAHLVRKLISKKDVYKIPTPIDFAKGQLDGSYNFTDIIPIHLLENAKILLEKLKPDLIQVELSPYMHLGSYFKLLGYPTIFVNHELGFDRLNSLMQSYSIEQTVAMMSVFEDLKAREQWYLNHYDAIISFSKLSSDSLDMNLDIIKDKLYTSPFPILDNSIIFKSKEQFKLNKLIFIGTDVHTPNKDAVYNYFHNLGATIFEETGLKLYVVGNWQVENREKLIAEWLIFEGFVDDLNSVMENSIMIVPLNFGGGIRTKILYSMGQFVPVISTSIGAEGIDHENKIWIANTKEEILKVVNGIYRDQNNAYQLASNAFNYIKSNYSQEIIAQKRLDIFSEVLKKRQN